MSEIYRLLNMIKSEESDSINEALDPVDAARIKRHFHETVQANVQKQWTFGKSAAAAVILISIALIGFPAGGAVYQQIRDAFVSDDGHLTVDAAIADTETESTAESQSEVPAQTALPQNSVFRVKAHEFTPDEVRRWAEVLFEGQTVYEPKRKMTRSELRSEISRFEEILESGSYKEEYKQKDEQEVMADYYRSIIDNYQQVLETAVDEYVRVPCDWQFHDGWYYDGDWAGLWEGTDEYDKIKNEQNLRAMTDDLHGKEAYLRVVKKTLAGQEKEWLLFSYGKEWGEQKYNDMPVTEMSPDEAEASADSLLSQLGIAENWILTGREVTSWETFPAPVYAFAYKPVFSGKKLLGRTNLRIEIGGGHVLLFEMESPVDMVETIETDPDTLSGESAYDALKKYLMTDYKVIGDYFGYDSPEEQQMLIDSLGEDYEVHIYDSESCMCRIREEEQTDCFLVVPAWHFKADIAGCGDTDLYVNALNGEIIKPEQGY